MAVSITVEPWNNYVEQNTTFSLSFPRPLPLRRYLLTVLDFLRHFHCVKPWKFQMLSIVAAASTLTNTSPSQYKWKCLSIFISILKTPEQLGNSYLAGTRVIWHFLQGSSCQEARYWLSPSLWPHSILSLPTENDIFSPQWQAVQDE